MAYYILVLTQDLLFMEFEIGHCSVYGEEVWKKRFGSATTASKQECERSCGSFAAKEKRREGIYFTMK